MTHTPRALLFDMDGVLVRSEEVWFRLVEEEGRRFRGRAITREEFAPTFGQGTAADVEKFGLSCTPEELDAFYLSEFTRYLDHVEIDPEAAHVLASVRARGLKTAVVTNTMTPLAREVLRHAGLLEFFDFVGCADQVPRAKPAPDLVVHVLTQLGLEASQAWMVGDSRFDHEAARAAGVRFVGYRRDGDLRAETLGELLGLLESAPRLPFAAARS